MKFSSKLLLLVVLACTTAATSQAQSNDTQPDRAQLSEEFNPVERRLQNAFQRENLYRGFRFEVFPLSNRDPDKDGFVIVDFKTKRKLVVTPERAAQGIPDLDYFEVNYHENRYEFGIRGRDIVVPISNRMAPFAKKRKGHEGLKRREKSEPGSPEYAETQKTIADKMAIIRQHNAKNASE